MELAPVMQREGMELPPPDDSILAELAPAELSRKGILKTWGLVQYTRSQYDLKGFHVYTLANPTAEFMTCCSLKGNTL